MARAHQLLSVNPNRDRVDATRQTQATFGRAPRRAQTQLHMTTSALDLVADDFDPRWQERGPRTARLEFETRPRQHGLRTFVEPGLRQEARGKFAKWIYVDTRLLARSDI